MRFRKHILGFCTAAAMMVMSIGLTGMVANAATAPAVPTISKIRVVDDTSVRLSWEAVPGATGYYIYRTTAGGSYAFIAGTQQTYYVDKQLKAQESYYYKIVAYSKDSSGNIAKSAQSGFKSIKVNFEQVKLTTVTNDSSECLNGKSAEYNLSRYSEKDDGIYFFDGEKVSFYDFSKSKLTTIYNLNSNLYYSGAYLTEDALYLCHSTTVEVVNLRDTSNLKTFNVTGVDYIRAIGADAKGRIYLGGEKWDDTNTYFLKLYSADGKSLSYCSNPYPITRFDSFDEKTGKFVFEDSYNWIYWGYDHYGYAIKVGSVDASNQIKQLGSDATINAQEIPASLDGHLDYACQNDYRRHYINADILGGKYIMTHSYTFGRDCIISLSNYKYLMKLDPVPLLGTDEWDDTDSIGVRAVYRDAKGTILKYTAEREITEYNPTTGLALAKLKTAHPVYNMFMSGDELILFELENNKCYVERIMYSEPTKLTLTGESHTMKVGEDQQLTLKLNSVIDNAITYTSSNPSVASVSPSGKVISWKAGSTTITASCGNLKQTYVVTVVDGSSINHSYRQVVSGENDWNLQNAGDWDYRVWSSPVNSYWNDNGDGTYTKLQYDGDQIIIEKYNKNFAKTSTKKLAMSLPIFGGAYFGATHNYIAYGQYNEKEDDSRTVVRVVKYTKDWVPVSSTNIKGANTYIPFDAGSLRMDEKNGKLYVYTCHEMYQSRDGYHHQANMTFVIRQSDMVMVDSYSDVMNLGYGYVSHSFNQYVKTDSKYLFRADHGDAHPRGISITRASLNDKITNVSYTIPITFAGEYGYNSTGASLGGLELGTDTVLIVGNSVSGDDLYGIRNAFLAVADKETLESKVIYLSNYSANGSIRANTPQLVKIDNERFLVMWSEYNNDTASVVKTELRLIDAYGTVVQRASLPISELNLSGCQPVYCNDGLIRWYCVDSKTTSYYAINPFYIDRIVLDYNHPAESKITSVVSANSGMQVTWSKANNASGYYLYRALPGGSYSFVGGVTGTTYNDTAANVLGQTYFYKVVPFNKVDSTIIKAAASPAVAGKKTLYAPPITETFRLSDKEAKITWTKVNGADGYYVYRALPGGSYSFVAGVLSPTYTDKKLEAGKEYFYKVVAFKKMPDNTELKSVACAAKKVMKDKVVMKSATAINSFSVNVSWNAMAGANGYYVYRATAGGSYEFVGGTTGTTYKDTNLKYETIYYYKVVAYYNSDSAKIKTPMSNFVSVKTK